MATTTTTTTSKTADTGAGWRPRPVRRFCPECQFPLNPNDGPGICRECIPIN